MFTRAFWFRLHLTLFILIGVIGPVTLRAQDSPPRYDVFLGLRDGSASLYFVDARTGLGGAIPANGSGHALIETGVLFEQEGAVRIAFPDGQIGLFAAIPARDADHAVAWIALPGGDAVAWVVNTRRGDGIASELYLADSRGENRRAVLYESSTQGNGIVPLAIGSDRRTIFYTRIPDIFAYLDERPDFPTYEGVLRADTETGMTTPLPDGTGCPCPVGFSKDGRWFARLEPAGVQAGFSLRVWEIETGLEFTAPAIRDARGVDRAGGVLFSPFENRIFYTGGRGRAEYALFSVDLAAGAQRALIPQLRSDVRPLGFSAGGEHLLLTGTSRAGTYKYALADGTFTTLSNLTFLGQLVD